MATKIRAQSNDEFIDIPYKKEKSVIDQLGVGFKTSLETLWKFLKNIDVTLPLSQDKAQVK
jgi:hypothetical protein